MKLGALRDQAAAVHTLSRARARGRLAQAYLFDGPSGVGKERAARALAQSLVCRAPDADGDACGACDACRRSETDSHPDVRVFRPRDEGQGNLQVETVRAEILPFTHFAPFEAPAAFVIFTDADVCFPTRHAEAANALLKTIEEPRANVHFVFASSRADRLLTTIRSRCQRVRFGRLSDTTLDALLRDRGIPEERRSVAVVLADGRADRALALSEPGAAEALFDAARSVDRAMRSRDPADALGVAEGLAKHADLDGVAEALRALYRDALVRLVGAPEPLLRLSHLDAETAELAATSTADELDRRIARLDEALTAIEANAAPELALDAALLAAPR